MRDEPNIVKMLKDAEKLGILQSKVHGAHEELETPRESLEDISDETAGFAENIVGRKTGGDDIVYEDTAETLLGKAENLCSILQSIDDLIFVIDIDGTFKQYYRSSLETELYVPPEKFLGKHFSDILPSDVAELLQTAIKEIKTSGETQQFDYSLKIKDRNLWFNARVAPIKDRRGVFTGITVVAHDITKYKQMQEELQEEEEKFRMIFENVTDMIAYVDNHGRILDVNKRVEDLLGYSREEVIGKNFAKLGILGLKELPRMIKLFRNTTEDGKAVATVEVMLKHKNGNKIFVEVGTKFIKHKGKVDGVVNVFRDITDRKKAEESSKTHAKELEILNEIITSGNKAQNLQSLLKDILNSTLELMGFEGGGIYIVDETTRTAELACHKGLPSDFIEDTKQEKIDESPYDTIFIRGQPIITDNYSEIEPRRSQKWGFLSVASIPISIEDKIIGALNVASKINHSFSDEEKNTLQSIGQNTGSVIAKMQAEEELKEKIDELERYKNVTVDRELRMVELKNRIKELEGKLEEK